MTSVVPIQLWTTDMALATEGKRAHLRDDQESPPAPKSSTRFLQVSVAIAMMAVAANCFLKYLWWTAKYSALEGVPKVAKQWQAAGNRATFYGWSLLLLEIACIVILFTAIRLSSIQSFKLRNALRLFSSVIITMVGTAFLSLVLSWINQAIP